MIDEKTYVGRIVKALAGFYYIRRQEDGIVVPGGYSERENILRWWGMSRIL